LLEEATAGHHAHLFGERCFPEHGFDRRAHVAGAHSLEGSKTIHSVIPEIEVRVSA
jgi:hypothetical protein